MFILILNLLNTYSWKYVGTCMMGSRGERVKWLLEDVWQIFNYTTFKNVKYVMFVTTKSFFDATIQHCYNMIILSVITFYNAHIHTFLQCPFDVSCLFTDGMQTSIQCRNKEQRLREWDWTSSLTLKEKHLQISNYLKLNATWYVAGNTHNVCSLESECVEREGCFIKSFNFKSNNVNMSVRVSFRWGV